MREIERFRTRYELSGTETFLAVELEALGTDYSANGYTTREQADEIGDWLDLRHDNILLDVGAGCGWPGLYLAKRHGCTVISLEPVSESMPTLTQRASADIGTKRVLPIIGGAGAIPLTSASVDAVVHADVLC